MLNPVLTNISNLNVSTNACVSMKDSTKTTPITMKIDPKGFYLYWINQSKVIDTLSLAQILCVDAVEVLCASHKHSLTVRDGGSHVWVTHMQSVFNLPELLDSLELRCIFRRQQLVEVIDWCWCGLILLPRAAELHSTKTFYLCSVCFLPY